MKELERVLKALANKRRLAIIKYLKSRRKASVGEIAKEIKLSFKATSKHLGILAVVDIIDKEQQGSLMFYSLNKQLPPVAEKIITLL